MPAAGRKGAHARGDRPPAVVPDGVRRIDHVWIPLSDGTRLAARVWLPQDAERRPVPGLLEAVPYRKNDGTSVADAGRHGYFAAHGYASVRVDIRGSGDSDGVLLDEYLEQEQDDLVEVIAWIAGQPWCDGGVGMFGYSWGGFAALQAAARRPPQLKAVVSVASTDDRYADDVHYMGGCLLAYYLLSWATTMHVYATLPPDPEVVGERWREDWLARLQGARPMIEPWLTHQRRDGYWQHGSVCEDAAAITCPVYLAGGWADGYRSAVLRMLEQLSCPRKAVIGPWSHHFPNDQIPPGPAIGFLQECVRWWDQWLKGRDTGVMDEPMLRTWMQDPVPPRASYRQRPGRWLEEPAWPSPHVQVRPFGLDADGIERGGEQRPLTLRSPQSTGVDAGDWDPFGNPADLPPDQRAEDGRSLVFDSLPLAEPLPILGIPVVRLDLECDRPAALVAVRLCDVAADGASTLITRGLLNLTHRDGHDHPHALVPGRRVQVEVVLKAIGQIVPAGHRLRVAVSNAYWPWAWPSPEPATLTLHPGSGCSLELPLRGSWQSQPEPRPFAAPEQGPLPETETLAFEPGDHIVERSIAANSSRLVHRYPAFHTRFAESGLELRSREPDTFTIEDEDPLSARVLCERSTTVSRDGWSVTVEATSTMQADAESFHVTTDLRAFEGGRAVHAGAWSFRIPRDQV